MHSKRVTLGHIIKLSKDKENFEISKTNDRNPQSDYEMSHQKPRIQDGNMLDTFKMLKKKQTKTLFPGILYPAILGVCGYAACPGRNAKVSVVETKGHHTVTQGHTKRKRVNAQTL